MEIRFFCPVCKQKLPDALMTCPHCNADLSEAIFTVDCLNCGATNSVIYSHCEKCGASLTGVKRAEHYLKYDPEIAAMNDKYAQCGVKRLGSIVGLIASFGAMYVWLEYDWWDIFFTLGILGVPVFLVMVVIFSIRRKILGKKIRKALIQIG